MNDPQGNEPGITQLLIAWSDGQHEALEHLRLMNVSAAREAP